MQAFAKPLKILAFYLIVGLKDILAYLDLPRGGIYKIWLKTVKMGGGWNMRCCVKQICKRRLNFFPPPTHLVVNMEKLGGATLERKLQKFFN